MKSQWKSCATAALIGTALLSTGCQSLPWVGNRKGEPSMTAQQYAEQAAANIQYDTAVDLDADYQPPVATSFSAASTSASPRPSSGGGSCCH
ncbi:hypothetical protein [Rhodopirellula sp. P2]|uniref:hypothetical protein n=1 Tax=Rhodopirellula sp. P2 TaxID=2127060 RepID=UPI0023686A84|nr:hypothetical protein [Rhodopirellula sp. P2]WDQ17053.1 hypothetical protein PSR62_00530 [Rhodopirellula sp. P2]